MARLSIPDEQTFAEFTVATPTTVFPITFRLISGKSDLTVLVDGVALDGSAYGFTGTLLDGGGYAGGTVTLNTAVDDVTLRIERNVSPTRTSQFAPSNSVPVGVMDMALNRLTASQQDLERRKTDLPRGELASKFLAFDADGNPIASSGTGADAGLRQDMAAPTGTTLLNYQPAGAHAEVRDLQGKLRELVSILDFIPANLHVAIAAGVHTGDLTPYWEKAQEDANGAPILFPKGVYFGNFVIDRSGAGMIGGVQPNYNEVFAWSGGTLLRPFDVTKPVVTLDGDASGGFLSNNRIENLGITATANSGVTQQAPCIYITNTMDSRTVNEMVLRNLDLRGGSAGIYCDGGCLTATLENIFARFNVDGIVLKSADAALYINGWVSTNVHTGYNDRHGLVTDSVSLSSEMVWNGLKSEFNGLDATVPECFGIYMRNTEGWTFPALYLEGNGGGVDVNPPITSGKSYGLRMEGLNRGFGLDAGTIILKSTFPVRITGTNPSGTLNNFYNVVPLTLASVTGATWSSAGGGQATLTVNVDLTTLFAVGDGLIVRAVGSTGGTGRGYNGMFPIVSITSTTIVVSHPLNSSPGTFSSNGLVNAPEYVIEGAWSGDLPKIQLGSSIVGNVYSPFDGNGAYLTTPGVDYVGAPSATLSLRHRKAVMINTASGDVRLTAITGLRPGETFQIVAGPFVTTYDVILDASLMLGGADSVIAAKTGKTYMVLGAGIGVAAFVEV